MNCTYRSIWNDTTGTFVAVSENAKSAGKKTSSCTSAKDAGARFILQAMAVSVMLSFGANVYALPAGGVVTAGGASISSGAGNTTITQSTQNAAINWQSFNIAPGEAVRFVQPNSNSVALNRVLGSDPSSILGSLSANGKVFLVNPNGILFGKGASVNVGGLVASTLNITDSDFMAGRYKFSGTGSGTVLNQGTINADGGYVALLGANVSNDGIISAKLGTVALAAGNAVTLDVAGDGLLNVTVNQGAVNALVQNGGLIQADGGQVLLTAQAAGSLLQSAVNNTGVIQAQTLENHNGTIRLLGDMQSGTVNVGGTLDASAPNGGNGGFIETSAAHVNVQDNVHITTAAAQGQTGTWLIDPVDYTIAATGGDITGAQLSANLVNNNVTILSSSGANGINGDINVNDPVSWTASGTPTTLTLQAVRDVNINQPITATKGNLVVCCGRDVNVNALITTTGVVATPNTGGNILLSAGRDVNIVRSSDTILSPNKHLAGITTTSGNIEICAARDINLGNTFDVAALITLTGSVADSLPPTGPVTPRGMTLIAGTQGTGPGAAGGTLNIGTGTIITVTGPAGISPINIYYNPTSYLTPTSYSGFFATSDGAPFTQYMLVFPDGGGKTYDGTTLTTFTGLKGTPAGVTLNTTGGTANFDTAAVGTGKTVSFTGFTLTQAAIVTGGTATNFALPVTCCSPIVGKTTAAITPAPLTVTASNVTKTYGQAPTLSGFSTTGLVNGETVGSVTEASPGQPTTASVVGSPYAITPSSATGGTFTPTNYTITYVNGVLTVTPVVVPPGTTIPGTTTPGTTSVIVPEEMIGVEEVVTPEEMMGGEEVVTPLVVPPGVTAVVLAKAPPELLSLVPTPVPVETPVVVPVPPPEVYVAPPHQRKQDRN